MNIQCSSCGKSLEVDAKLAGRRVKCPCNAVTLVPGVATAHTSAKGAAQPIATAPAMAAPPAVKLAPAPAGGLGIDRAQMPSLFGELTANDMIVKGPSTAVKPGKKK